MASRERQPALAARLRLRGIPVALLASACSEPLIAGCTAGPFSDLQLNRRGDRSKYNAPTNILRQPVCLGLDPSGCEAADMLDEAPVSMLQHKLSRKTMRKFRSWPRKNSARKKVVLREHLGFIPRPVPGLSKHGDAFLHVGNSSMLVVTLLIADNRSVNASLEEDEYTPWIPKILRNNLDHVRKHGHSLAVRTQLTVPMPRGQLESCKRLSTRPRETTLTTCPSFYFRQNVNWEKFQLLADYLEHSQYHFSHVLFLDLDAAMVHKFNPDHDTVRTMAEELRRLKASALVANEDFANHPSQPNGGVMLWRNTDYSRRLLRGLVTAHLETFLDERKGAKNWRCKGDEQTCLSDVMKKPALAHRRIGSTKQDADIALVNGSKWNCHPCVLSASCPPQAMKPANWKTWQKKEGADFEIIHFMGKAKGALKLVI